MKHLSAFVLWIVSSGCQADLLTAMQAYQQHDFNTATQEFGALLPLANELAAFNLGAMAYNGEGQPRDPVKALAYFQLAASLGHADANAMAQKISGQLSQTEQQQAAGKLAALQQQVRIGRDVRARLLDLYADDRQALQRIEPRYPRAAAENGQFGTVTMRMLVNEQGDVESVDVLHAFPAGVFERAAVAALKRWKFVKAERKTIGRLVLRFWLDDIDQAQIQRFFSEHKLWEYAALGSPVHQYTLANLLDLVRSHSRYSQFVDKTLPGQLGPLSPDFHAAGQLVSDKLQLPAGLTHSPFVTLDNQGVVLSVHYDDATEQASLDAMLTGTRLTTEPIAAGFYLLQNRFEQQPAHLLSAQRIPVTYSEQFWLEQAARGGHLPAQRALAAFNPQWELYLLEQQDPVVQSWKGTNLILQGQRAEGSKLLDAAIAQGHPAAKALKAAL